MAVVGENRLFVPNWYQHRQIDEISGSDRHFEPILVQRVPHCLSNPKNVPARSVNVIFGVMSI